MGSKSLSPLPRGLVQMLNNCPWCRSAAVPTAVPGEESQQMASRTQRAHGQHCVQLTALAQEALPRAPRNTEIASMSLDVTVRNRFSEGPYSEPPNSSH